MLSILTGRVIRGLKAFTPLPPNGRKSWSPKQTDCCDLLPSELLPLMGAEVNTNVSFSIT